MFAAADSSISQSASAVTVPKVNKRYRTDRRNVAVVIEARLSTIELELVLLSLSLSRNLSLDYSAIQRFGSNANAHRAAAPESGLWL